MKILVCISEVPDTTAKISFVNNDSEFNKEGVQNIINPYDEWYALVKGLELIESHGGELMIATVGEVSVEPIMRKALAIGGEKAVRINTNPKDSYETAKLIADYARSENFDLILGGKETISYNGGMVMGIIAGLLDYEYFSQCSSLDSDGKHFKVGRNTSTGKDVYEAPKGVVVSASKGMAQQRIPNMRGIMQARTKKIEVIEPKGNERLSHTVKFSLPEERSGCKIVETPEALIEVLKHEAKVL